MMMDASLASFCPSNTEAPEQQPQPPQQHGEHAPEEKDGAVAVPAAAVAPPSNTLQRRNVYVSGLPETFRASDFRALCQSSGRVEASKLCVDTKCRPTKGYGFALFFDEAAAARCIKELNGRFVAGRPLQARLADAAATPTPLDPTSAHSPIARAKTEGKTFRTPNSSMNSADFPLHLTACSIPLSPSSSHEVTPPFTPPQLTLLQPPDHASINSSLSVSMNSNMGAAQALLYPQMAMEQAVGYHPIASYSPQPGYVSVSPALMQPHMVGMPMYFTVTPPGTVSEGAQQQFVVPTTMLAPGACPPQHLYSPIVFGP